MKLKMKPELHFLMDEIEESLNEAYTMGLEEGGKANKVAIDSKKDMLIRFESYLSAFRRLENEDMEPIFIRKDAIMPSGIFLSTLIKNFLLSYDDE